ncbi:hypothetical protein GCM10028803_05310 [Larkinella knui]|uniref:Uncharacterized protein n=1 Tax=Larkinella knui TaxID=2025310 RepID=A0A3P1CKD9_9BACT|nr:hypothetical protein [Larkinella knui]RRB13791.1 hypothetical protein EHT87_16160 [Larkinella knui]
MDVSKEENKPILGSLKDELFLLSFLVISIGVVYTDAYYQFFGFKYQFWNLSTTHIIYKGITTLFVSPLLIIPYLTAIILIIIELIAIRLNWLIFIFFRVPLSYLVLLVLLAILYPLSARAGELQARKDLYAHTTTLPKIKLMVVGDLKIRSPEDSCVLFMLDGSFVIYFTPLAPDDKAAAPIIKRVQSSSVTILETYTH